MALASESDRRYFSLNWHASVCIEFNLSPIELTSLEAPPPIFLDMPRSAYLPVVHAQIRAHFIQSAPAIEDEIWFDCDGIPLKWQLPVGVLADLLGSPLSGRPLLFTVHFQRFPAKTLSRCKNLFALRQQFFNTIKEASTIRYGSVKHLIGGAAIDHSRLWDSLLINSGRQTASREENFLSAAQKIFQPVTINPFFNTAQAAIAVRFFLRGFSAGEDSEELENSLTPVQRIVKTKKNNQTEETLGDAIESNFPLLRDYQVWVQGVSPPLSTPLAFLGCSFLHPDLFLYVIIRKNTGG